MTILVTLVAAAIDNPASLCEISCEQMQNEERKSAALLKAITSNHTDFAQSNRAAGAVMQTMFTKQQGKKTFENITIRRCGNSESSVRASQQQ
jgi:hypothetical protein